MTRAADAAPSDPNGRAERLGVWSAHAADLARHLAEALLPWPENPTQASQVLAGELVRLAPGLYLPGNLRPGMIDRALLVGLAAGSSLRSHHVVAGPSAAWVLLGGRRIPSLELATPVHRSIVPGFDIRHVPIPAGDVLDIGGVPVTVASRTAADLLRFGPRSVALELVPALVASGWCRTEEIAPRLIGQARRRGIARARELLAELEGPRQCAGSTGWPSAVTR
jgi:hypothetical protein